ncbi:hypothetical protein DM02DRAFT_621157 [Periconia macrospinosa]|uniref:Uncharacterized protein n=1 Tax=Periconia macrospinosa TaxID=97972 RepID=A0A2V1CWL1_9PLEO|nr:hypothetical protein DM02DRAFT_621157 [Periconia macrospinosa]
MIEDCTIEAVKVVRMFGEILLPQDMSQQGITPQGMAPQGMAPRGITYGRELISQLFSF